MVLGLALIYLVLYANDCCRKVYSEIGPFLNDIGHNANNANNGNPKSPMSFKYRYFVNSIFPLLFKNDNFNNPKSTLSSEYDTHFSDVI